MFAINQITGFIEVKCLKNEYMYEIDWFFLYVDINIHKSEELFVNIHKSEKLL